MRRPFRDARARSAPITLTVVALAVAGAACGNAAQRSTSKFCGELQAHAIQIQTPPTKTDEIPALITLYSKMGEVAPLEIQEDWEKLYGSLKTATTVDPNNPASVQVVTDAAYAAQHSAQQVVTWAQDNCGITLAPVGVVPGGADVAAVVTTTTAAPAG